MWRRSSSREKKKNRTEAFAEHGRAHRCDDDARAIGWTPMRGTIERQPARRPEGDITEPAFSAGACREATAGLRASLNPNVVPNHVSNSADLTCAN
jgi:hypothetical protein